jgi:hypothetical protein
MGGVDAGFADRAGDVDGAPALDTGGDHLPDTGVSGGREVGHVVGPAAGNRRIEGVASGGRDECGGIRRLKDLQRAAGEVCDVGAIIHRGRIVAQGPPAEHKAREGAERARLEDGFPSLTAETAGGGPADSPSPGLSLRTGRASA